MIKNECEIIKDLLPNYIEETTSKTTNEYIENHIEDCSSCKEILKLLQKEREREEKREERKEKKKINYLKRYNIKIRILQGISIILAGIIIGSWIFLGGKLIEKTIKEKQIEEETKIAYEVGRENYEIITKAYNALEEIRAKENYIITCEYHNENEEMLNLNYKTTFYYKDGKYKREQENFFESETIEELEFGTRKNDKEGAIKFFANQKDGKNHKEINTSVYRIEKIYTLDNFYNAGQITAGKFEIRNETYNGKECVVIKDARSSYPDELWIEKETNFVVKTVNAAGTSYQTICNYTITPNVVTDEDLKIPSTEGYEVSELTKFIIEEYVDI